MGRDINVGGWVVGGEEETRDCKGGDRSKGEAESVRGKCER